MTHEKRASNPLAVWVLWFFGLTVLLVVSAIVFLAFGSHLQRLSAGIGWGVSFVVCLSSGYLAFWSLGRSHNTFLLVALGGVVVRLAFIAGAVFVGLSLLKLHTTVFLVSLLGSYTVYHGLEILMLNQSKALTRSTAVSDPVNSGNEAH